MWDDSETISALEFPREVVEVVRLSSQLDFSAHPSFFPSLINFPNTSSVSESTSHSTQTVSISYGESCSCKFSSVCQFLLVVMSMGSIGCPGRVGPSPLCHYSTEFIPFIIALTISCCIIYVTVSFLKLVILPHQPLCS